MRVQQCNNATYTYTHTQTNTYVRVKTLEITNVYMRTLCVCESVCAYYVALVPLHHILPLRCVSLSACAHFEEEEKVERFSDDKG